jgi:hypothetical protein
MHLELCVIATQFEGHAAIPLIDMIQNDAENLFQLNIYINL